MEFRQRARHITVYNLCLLETRQALTTPELTLIAQWQNVLIKCSCDSRLLTNIFGNPSILKPGEVSAEFYC